MCRLLVRLDKGGNPDQEDGVTMSKFVAYCSDQVRAIIQIKKMVLSCVNLWPIAQTR